MVGLQPNTLKRIADTNRNNIPDDSFLDQLVRCQDSRLEDQRSPLPPAVVDAELDPPLTLPDNNSRKSGATVPDEDFFSLIMRFQSGRMDDQRASVPRMQNKISNGSIPHARNESMASNHSSGKKKK